MSTRAKEGTLLEGLLTLAIPLLQKAEVPPTPARPGRVPIYRDWQIAMMILPGLLKKRKSKSAVFCQMNARKELLLKLLNLERLPARSTFMERYDRVWPMVQQAILLQGRVAVRDKLAMPKHVAADKSIIKARGPVWHQKFRKKGIKPKLRGLDFQAGWGRSASKGWSWGYSYEVAVCAGKDALLFPLLASVDTAQACEMTTLTQKICQLPKGTQTLAIDKGYDSDRLGDLFEFKGGKRRKGRHFLCPPHRIAKVNRNFQGQREKQRQRRLKRIAYLETKAGRRLYQRRKETVELFNANFKSLFELEQHVWHRGINNNRTQLLLAIFSYQLLMRYHYKQGYRDAQIQYLIDSL